MLITKDEILSVSKVSHYIHRLLDENLNHVWVQGETSNLKRSKAGHVYFTIKDAHACIPCILLEANAAKNPIADNTHVLMRCSAQNYQPTGRLQLCVHEVSVMEEGRFHNRFEALKKKLHQEGLFDPKHKKILPNIIEHVALVTSAAGDAVLDVCQTLQTHVPFVRIHLYSTYVQGTQAPNHLIASIAKADAKKADAIIIARGGGSEEDLAPFNDEQLVRAIFKTNTPIICGIGHEANTTLCDFVCDYRASTPSLAAQIVIDQNKHLATTLALLAGQLRDSMRPYLSKKIQQLTVSRQKFEFYQSALISHFFQCIQDHKHALRAKLLSKVLRLQNHMYFLKTTLHTQSPSSKILAQKQRLLQVQTLYLQQLKRHITQFYKQIKHLQELLLFGVSRLWYVQNAKIQNLCNKIQNANPTHILKKGYAILLNDHGDVVTDSRSVAKHQILLIQTQFNTIKTKVLQK